MARQNDSDPDLVIDEGQVYGRVRHSEQQVSSGDSAERSGGQTQQKGTGPREKGTSEKGTSEKGTSEKGTSEKGIGPRGRIMRAIRKRLKPIYIGPLQPDSTGILNVRGHLGFMVFSFAMAAIGFAIFELIPVALGNGFYCLSIAIPFGMLSIGLANSEFYAMKHKSIDSGLNRTLCKIGLILGGVGGFLGLCVNVLGWIFYMR